LRQLDPELGEAVGNAHGSVLPAFRIARRSW
jgi:hypothetical protein